ncbi:hypothetical protein V8B97DRAFT_709402 [Scleroderma yunnanense]
MNQMAEHFLIYSELNVRNDQLNGRSHATTPNISDRANCSDWSFQDRNPTVGCVGPVLCTGNSKAVNPNHHHYYTSIIGVDDGLRKMYSRTALFSMTDLLHLESHDGEATVAVTGSLNYPCVIWSIMPTLNSSRHLGQAFCGGGGHQRPTDFGRISLFKPPQGSWPWVLLTLPIVLDTLSLCQPQPGSCVKCYIPTKYSTACKSV